MRKIISESAVPHTSANTQRQAALSVCMCTMHCTDVYAFMYVVHI